MARGPRRRSAFIAPPVLPDAACAGHDPNLWQHPDPTSREARTAVSICGTCPVRIDCGTHALDQHEDGIWGGLHSHQRASLIRLIEATA